jgi:hypothetical protein
MAAAKDLLAGCEQCSQLGAEIRHFRQIRPEGSGVSAVDDHFFL